jgi:pimeloyl-ACP methyl ester carboxylesterase
MARACGDLAADPGDVVEVGAVLRPERSVNLKLPIRVVHLAIVMIGAAFLQPMLAQTPSEPRFPPPGKLVDVGGYRVHLNCTGEGSPTVMIVGAGYSFDWSLVQPEVATFTRVCTYDPSGSVWSDPGPTPSCQGRVEEIHAMLHNAGITSPLILVGHSVGAAFARLYAARYPREVEGMVIGDHAGRYRFQTPPGMVRSEEETLKRLSPLARDMHHWAAAQAGTSSNSRAENQFFNTCIEEAATTTKARPDTLGARPLIVIANEYLAGSEDYRTFQSSLLALSSNSKAVIAVDSSHGVPIENPDVFIRAIREVSMAARNKTKLQ